MYWHVLNSLGQSVSKIRQEKFWASLVFIWWTVLNIHFGTFVRKYQTRKKFELCQNDLIFKKIFELYHVSVCQNELSFWTISSAEMFQYSQILYTKSMA